MTAFGKTGLNRIIHYTIITLFPMEGRPCTMQEQTEVISQQDGQKGV